MRIPDWVIFLIVAAVVLWSLLGREGKSTAPLNPPVVIQEGGPALPGPDRFDDQVLVQVGELSDGVGTAFALDQRGLWLTARHVVDGCAEVGLVAGRGRIVPVQKVEVDSAADVAIIYTRRASQALPVSVREDLKIGETGFHFGFPQGKPGEAVSQLLARNRLITRGRYRNEEPILAWAEKSRTRGIYGSLGGISGGPVLDSSGQTIGVTIAESPRRGRIYTTAPETLDRILSGRLTASDQPDSVSLAADNYVQQANRLRSRSAIVQVVCRAEKGI